MFQRPRIQPASWAGVACWAAKPVTAQTTVIFHFPVPASRVRQAVQMARAVREQQPFGECDNLEGVTCVASGTVVDVHVVGASAGPKTSPLTCPFPATNGTSESENTFG